LTDIRNVSTEICDVLTDIRKALGHHLEYLLSLIHGGRVLSELTRDVGSSNRDSVRLVGNKYGRALCVGLSLWGGHAGLRLGWCLPLIP
jgi:hypothetical protein